MKGSCLCGKVVYEVQPPFRMFQYCHCSRCRKFTGSAHASNLFVSPDQFKWLQGERFINRFEKPDAKYFATCFCNQCGSSLPWQAQGVPNIVIPAGTLDEEPNIQPRHCIFWSSRPNWFVETHNLTKHMALPEKTKK